MIPTTHFFPNFNSTLPSLPPSSSLQPHSSTSNPLIKDIFGYASLVFVAIELLPHLYRNYRRKSCDGLSSVMMILGCTGCMLSSVYNIVQGLALSVTLQTDAWLLFALICWMQYYHYSRRWKVTRSLAIFAGIIVTVAVLQALFIFSLMHIMEHQVTWATTAIGIIPSVLYVIGFIPQWLNFWRMRCGYGISVAYVAMDIIGSILPVISLAFHDEFNWIAASTKLVSIVGMSITLAIVLYLRRRYKDEAFFTPTTSTTATSTENEVYEQADQMSSQQTLGSDNVILNDNYEVKQVCDHC
jgi:uncharacterized protein with PQ loop repeat